MNNPQAETRSRVSLDVSPMVLSHLDHIVDITGASRAAVVLAMVLEVLPAHLERADALQKRFRELNQQGKKR